MGRKIKVHSTTGKKGMLWIAKTAFWKISGPPLRLELVSRWTHM
jgi:hypothetical protein